VENISAANHEEVLQLERAISCGVLGPLASDWTNLNPTVAWDSSEKRAANEKCVVIVKLDISVLPNQSLVVVFFLLVPFALYWTYGKRKTSALWHTVKSVLEESMCLGCKLLDDITYKTQHREMVSALDEIGHSLQSERERNAVLSSNFNCLLKLIGALCDDWRSADNTGLRNVSGARDEMEKLNSWVLHSSELRNALQPLDLSDLRPPNFRHSLKAITTAFLELNNVAEVIMEVAEGVESFLFVDDVSVAFEVEEPIARSHVIATDDSALSGSTRNSVLHVGVTSNVRSDKGTGNGIDRGGATSPKGDGPHMAATSNSDALPMSSPTPPTTQTEYILALRYRNICGKLTFRTRSGRKFEEESLNFVRELKSVMEWRLALELETYRTSEALKYFVLKRD